MKLNDEFEKSFTARDRNFKKNIAEKTLFKSSFFHIEMIDRPSSAIIEFSIMTKIFCGISIR